MHFTTLSIATALLPLALASPLEARGGCNDVHFITARGTGQPTPDNQDNELVPAVCNHVRSQKGKTCGYEDVHYPAAYAFTPQYCPDSVTPGVKAALKQINAYAKKCPKSKIVLAGYSQGAEVLGDVLSGPGGGGCQPGTSAIGSGSQAGKNSKFR